VVVRCSGYDCGGCGWCLVRGGGGGRGTDGSPGGNDIGPASSVGVDDDWCVGEDEAEVGVSGQSPAGRV
jgi:hypothetical protein